MYLKKKKKIILEILKKEKNIRTLTYLLTEGNKLLKFLSD